MTDGQRYVTVELFGGPRDGDKLLFEFPPVQEWEFEQHGTIDHRPMTTHAMPERVPIVVHRYVMSASQPGYEVLTLLPDQVKLCVEKPEVLHHIASRKKAMHFEYEGRFER